MATLLEKCKAQIEAIKRGGIGAAETNQVVEDILAHVRAKELNCDDLGVDRFSLRTMRAEAVAKEFSGLFRQYRQEKLAFAGIKPIFALYRNCYVNGELVLKDIPDMTIDHFRELNSFLCQEQRADCDQQQTKEP